MTSTGKTCLVTFGYNETVCKDLTDTRWNDIENDVQKKVSGNFFNALFCCLIFHIFSQFRKLLYF